MNRIRITQIKRTNTDPISGNQYNPLHLCAIKNQHGYTIIEILVGINLSFILITLLVGLYLFSFKFTTITTKRFEEKVEMTSFMNRMYKLLERSDDFYINQKDTTTILVLNNVDTIFFSTSFIGNNFLNEEEKVDDYELTITKLNGLKAIVSNGELNSEDFDDHRINSVIRSAAIKDMRLTLTKSPKIYEFNFTNPTTGIKNFKNLEDTK